MLLNAKAALVAACIILFAGCASAPQQPISFDRTKIESKDKVAIVMSETPSAQMTYPGANCLLCLAAAAATNSGLSAHAKTLSTADLSTLNGLVKSQLEDAGYEVVVIDNPVNIAKLPKLKKSAEYDAARRNFSTYKESHGVSHVAVINLTFAGIQRNYASYVPMEVPKAVIQGETYLINLNTNKYAVYQPISQYLYSQGEWNQKDSYENITNAYYQAVENVRDQITKDYASN